MTETTRLFVVSEMHVGPEGPEAHAPGCEHEGTVFGTITGPRDGSGYLFTGTVAQCLTEVAAVVGVNVSHAVKAPDLTVAYPSSGPHSGYAVLHATGCAHTLRKTTYGEPSHLGTGFAPYPDDYFEVAPCARKP